MPGFISEIENSLNELPEGVASRVVFECCQINILRINFFAILLKYF
jgi:hypothetical protein